jgi:TonB family protein
VHFKHSALAIGAFLFFGAESIQGQQSAAPVPASPQQLVVDEEAFLKGAYLTGAFGVQAPTLIRQIKPAYPPRAMREQIVGEVQLQIVVGIDGTVERARVVRSLDKTYGLDASAIDAVRQWKFHPGTLDGVPVPVVVNADVAFGLLSCRSDQGLSLGCDQVASRPVTAGQVSNEHDAFLMGAYLVGTDGVRAPTPVKEVKPRYTPEATQQSIQGFVQLQVVVGIDGYVLRARVTKSLDPAYGLDAEALRAAAQWRFKPGTLYGTAVPVAVPLQLEFRFRR